MVMDHSCSFLQELYLELILNREDEEVPKQDFKWLSFQNPLKYHLFEKHQSNETCLS